MALQEMPEKFENEAEEPTETQENTVESSSTASDENLLSDDSASSDVPVEESTTPESEELDVANQPAPESAVSSEAESYPDESSSQSTEETSADEPDVADQPDSEAASVAGSESSSDDSSIPATEEAAWYVIHCYSGYENKVRHNLEQRIETMGMKDKIFDVVIPTQEEIEVKDGKRRTVERHIFPGYVLVNLELSEESWYVVRNTPGVTGFVGMGNTPTPLRPEEVSQIIKRMEADAPTVKVTYKVGERVRIVDGPFNDFRGIVAEIDMERTKVRVNVSFFGRETPVELDFLQVEKA